MRRVLGLMLVLIATFGVLAGCGGDSSDKAGDSCKEAGASKEAGCTSPDGANRSACLGGCARPDGSREDVQCRDGSMHQYQECIDGGYNDVAGDQGTVDEGTVDQAPADQGTVDDGTIDDGAVDEGS